MSIFLFLYIFRKLSFHVVFFPSYCPSSFTFSCSFSSSFFLSLYPKSTPQLLLRRSLPPPHLSSTSRHPLFPSFLSHFLPLPFFPRTSPILSPISTHVVLYALLIPLSRSLIMFFFCGDACGRGKHRYFLLYLCKFIRVFSIPGVFLLCLHYLVNVLLVWCFLCFPPPVFAFSLSVFLFSSSFSSLYFFGRSSFLLFLVSVAMFLIRDCYFFPF